jgi:hypothetical protein
LFILLAVTLLAVIPQRIHAGWTRTYGGELWDWGESVQQTTDGGYIITGLIATGGVITEKLWLLKTDAKGDLLWECKYCCGCGNGVQQTGDGEYIVVGVIDFPDSNLWLLKIDSSGDSVWTRRYGGEENDWGECVRQTSDGGYIIAGYTSSLGTEKGGLWLLKTDSLGDTLWTRTYSQSWGPVGNCVEQTSDGGYIVLGKTGWLLKTDAYGNTLWRKSSYPFPRDGVGRCVHQTSDGGYIISGNFTCFSGPPFLIKTDADGELVWIKVYEVGSGEFVQQTNDSGYIFTGQTGAEWDDDRDICLQKTDAEGNMMWTRMFGGENQESGRCVQQTSDGGYIIVGSTESFGAGLSDLWLIKTNSLGLVDAVKEEPVADAPADWQVLSPIGQRIVLRYEDRPEGFHAQVFDATGRKVDEIHAAGSSGTIIWGATHSPGVYFIRSSSGSATAGKVILVE